MYYVLWNGIHGLQHWFQGYIFNIQKLPLQNCMDCKHCMLFGDYSRVVFYQFSNIWWIFCRVYFQAISLFTAWWIWWYPSQSEAPLHSAIEVLSQAGPVWMTPRFCLDLFAAAEQPHRSLLLSPKLSGEGAAFLEVSSGKVWRVKLIQKSCLPNTRVVWSVRHSCCVGNWGWQG